MPSVPGWTLVVAATFAVVIYLSSGPLNDPDVWWHVRLGRSILDTGHIPHRETWSYASLGHAWTPTAWLSDVTYGFLVDQWGYRSLIALKLAVCAAVAVMLLRLIRRTGASSPAVAFAFALTLLPLTFFLRERPQAFSLIFVVWLAAQCEKVRRGGSVRVVPFLALEWLWANVHGMWFLGPVFLLVAAAGDLADCRRNAVSRFRRHALTAVGAVAVAAITPVGPRLVTQPFRVQSAAHSISEWLPTVLWHRSLAPYLITLAVLTLSFVRRRHATPWADGVWFLAVVGFSLIASRDVAPAMILLAAPLAHGLDEVVRLPASARIPAIAPALLALVGVGFAVGGMVSEPVIAATQPTRLVQKLGTLPGPRHVLNDYTVGGLITGMQPRASVSIDGRTDNYSPAYVGDYLDALRLRGRWQHVLATLQPDCALLPVDSAMTHVLVAEYDWTVVAVQDGYALLDRGPRGRVTLSEPLSPLGS